MAKDKTVITYLCKATPSTQGIQTGRAIRLETPLPETHNNVKKNNTESFLERKRKRIIIFSGCRSKGGDSTGLIGE